MPLVAGPIRPSLRNLIGRGPEHISREIELDHALDVSAGASCR
jgi:hypothetical protein